MQSSHYCLETQAPKFAYVSLCSSTTYNTLLWAVVTCAWILKQMWPLSAGQFKRGSWKNKMTVTMLIQSKICAYYNSGATHRWSSASLSRVAVGKRKFPISSHLNGEKRNCRASASTAGVYSLFHSLWSLAFDKYEDPVKLARSQGSKRKSWGSFSYGLEVYVSLHSKFLYWSPNLQCDGIWRWALTMRVLFFEEEDRKLSLHANALRKGHVSTQQEGDCLQARKKDFTKKEICWNLDLGLLASRTMRINI